MKRDLRDLLTEMENFIGAKQMSATEFGLTVMHDGKFLSEIRSGKRKTVTLDTADRCREFIRNYPG
tara:strand:- start:784 stop:981 length:198 start_codon:yes stop_codon:yes gene_type:complete